MCTEKSHNVDPQKIANPIVDHVFSDPVKGRQDEKVPHHVICGSRHVRDS